MSDTQHPTPAPDPSRPPQPYSAALPPSGRARLPESTPVYTPFIWTLALLPFVSLALNALYRPEFRFRTVSGIRTVDPTSTFTPGYFALLGLGLVLYALQIVFSWLDHRELLRRGVERPFHWAWSFLQAAVYIIGRSVIVHRVARPRGLVPLWVWIGAWVISSVVATVIVLSSIAPMFQELQPPH